MGLTTQRRENPQTCLEKNPTCALGLGLWYLSWDQQDLQGVLAGLQPRCNTHVPFSQESEVQGLSSLAFTVIKRLPNKIY